MADRSQLYSDLEREAAITAIALMLVEHRTTHDQAGEVVDAVAGVFGMRRANPPFQQMGTAPHDRDVILRHPKRGEVRAVWWSNWVDPAVPHPWAWREARADGTVGPPVVEADGWREL